MKNANFKIALTVLLMCFCTVSRGQSWGYCGNDKQTGYNEDRAWEMGNVMWEFYSETGLLYFSGDGYMMDFDGESAPWFDEIDPLDILEVEVGDRVRSVGKGAFSFCDNLTKVTFSSNDIRDIRDEAFWCCNINLLDIPASVKNIGDNAFSDNYSMSSLKLHTGLENIGVSSFGSCAVTNLDLPEGLLSVGDDAFSGNENLQNVIIPASLNSLGGNCFDANNLKVTYLPNNTDLLKSEPFGGSVSEIICSSDIVNALPQYVGSSATRRGTYYLEFTKPIPAGFDYRAGTLCLPFDASIDADNATLALFTFEGQMVDDYRLALGRVNAQNGKIKLTKGVPYIYKTKKSSLLFTYTGAGTNVSTPMNGLIGNLSLETVKAPEGCCAISGNKFLYIMPGVTASVGQYRAYLDLSAAPTVTPSEAKLRNFALWGEDGSFEEDETSVDGICDADAVYAVGTYSVGGVKRYSQQKGLNIVKMSDGTVKKVMVK